jgi:flagellar biosynthesis/type III secretory pathway M-ring protein FliF/YscJ
MDFLKSQLDRIQQQLSGLNASQKMLAACLVAIIVMTVAWWGRQAGSSEVAPLFASAVDPAEAGGIKQLLNARGIAAEVGSDNRISVPAAKRNEALAELAVADAMPKDPAINFESFMKGLNPFASQTMGDAHLIHFKQARLAEVIREFPGVRGAQVFIDPTQKFGMNGNSVNMAATVNIKARDPKAITQALVDGAANLVLGAQAGLSWKNVTVMVNGVPRRVTDPETRGSEAPDILELRERYQQMYAARVSDLLMIPGLSVSVTFDVNPETVRRRSRTYDKAKSLSMPSETEEKTRESTGGGGALGGEPGAMPNTSMSVAPQAAASAESSTNESESRTKYENFASGLEEESVKFAGLGAPLGAAVMVPRSHIVNVLKVGKQNPPEPDEAQIEAWFTRKLPEFQKLVKTAVGLSSEEAVSMALYTDLIPPQPAVAAGAAPTGLSTSSIAAIAGSHSREIMLGGLAVVSLFMVSMMVRKGGPVVAPVLAGVQTTTPMPVLDATEALAGEVSEGKSMLDAMELDEDAVRAQQMVDQVAAMVEDNPDAAASLVKRWMSRT